MFPEDLAVKLLKKAFQGDRNAYEELLSALASHCQKQLKIGLRQYRDFPTELKQDITQEVLISFHQFHHTFDLSQPFFPWFNTLIRHKTIDFIRRKDFRVFMKGVDAEGLKKFWIAETQEDPVEAKEIFGWLAPLPRKQAELLILAKVQEYSNKEIAERLKMTESNVKVSIFRALNVLRRNASESL